MREKNFVIVIFVVLGSVEINSVVVKTDSVVVVV